MFAADVTYEMQNPNTLEVYGVIEVRTSFKDDETLSIKDVRIKTDERVKHLLSALLSHLQSNP
jgi:hypothetical protein